MEDEGVPKDTQGHPPCGGCGLKYDTVEASRDTLGHPPCGGCGLKYRKLRSFVVLAQSPSVWRVWIEMNALTGIYPYYKASPSVWRVWIEINLRCSCEIAYAVTLRVEGVD